jgi:hypothetical protein
LELAFADLIESGVFLAGAADPSGDPFIAILAVAPLAVEASAPPLDWAEQFAGQRFAIPRAIVNAAIDDPTLIRTGILLWNFVPAFWRWETLFLLQESRASLGRRNEQTHPQQSRHQAAPHFFFL